MLATTSMIYHLLFAETAEAAEALMVSRRERRRLLGGSSYFALAEENDEEEQKRTRRNKRRRRRQRGDESRDDEDKKDKKDREDRGDRDKKDREDRDSSDREDKKDRGDKDKKDRDSSEREDRPDRDSSEREERPDRGDKPVSALPVEVDQGEYDAYIAAVLDAEDDEDCPKQGEQRRRLQGMKGKPKKGKPKADPCRAVEAQEACEGAAKFAPDFKAVDEDFAEADCCDAVVEHTCVWVARPERPGKPQPEARRRLRRGGGNRGNNKQDQEAPEEERPTHVCMSTKVQEKILLKEACLALADEAACAADDRCDWFLPKQKEGEASRRSLMEEDKPERQPKCLPKRPEREELDEDERKAHRDERKQQAQTWLQTCLPKEEEEQQPPQMGLGVMLRRALRYNKSAKGGDGEKDGGERKQKGGDKKKGGEGRKGFKVPNLDELIDTCNL